MKNKILLGLFFSLFFVSLVVGAGFISSRSVGMYNISSSSIRQRVENLINSTN